MQTLFFLIHLMHTEHEGDILCFIKRHSGFFVGIPIRSLLPYKRTGTETDYVFLAGSYVYNMVSGTPVTWLERRRFAEYSFPEPYAAFFRKTISGQLGEKFQTLAELEAFLKASDLDVGVLTDGFAKITPPVPPCGK